MIEKETRTWIKPTAASVTDKAFNDAKLIELNKEEATEDAAIEAGWYPQDGGVAGSCNQEVPRPAWLPEEKPEEKPAKGKGAAKDGEAKE